MINWKLMVAEILLASVLAVFAVWLFLHRIPLDNLEAVERRILERIDDLQKEIATSRKKWRMGGGGA